MEPNKDYRHDLNNVESDNHSSEELRNNSRGENTAIENSETTASPDKYLAMEQQGVSYTPDADPMGNNPDHIEYRQHGQTHQEWDASNRNTRNSEAFNQDEYILRDNIDLDEGQSQSISSDKDIDTNTTDER